MPREVSPAHLRPHAQMLVVEVSLICYFPVDVSVVASSGFPSSKKGYNPRESLKLKYM